MLTGPACHLGPLFMAIVTAKTSALRVEGGRWKWEDWRRPTLPQGLPCSTIGADRLNCRVRDGNGCGPVALVASHFMKIDDCVEERECEEVALRCCAPPKEGADEGEIKLHGRLVRLG